MARTRARAGRPGHGLGSSRSSGTRRGHRPRRRTLSAWLITELLGIPERSAVEALSATAAVALLGLPALPSFRDNTAPPSGADGA